MEKELLKIEKEFESKDLVYYLRVNSYTGPRNDTRRKLMEKIEQKLDIYSRYTGTLIDNRAYM